MSDKFRKTLVLGASANPARYSFLAVNKLRENNHPVIAVGKRPAQVADVVIENKTFPITDLDTVSIYLNKENQKNYYNYIIEQHPQRVIFNPGAENPEFEMMLADKDIKVLEACTLVLLATGQF